MLNNYDLDSIHIFVYSFLLMTEKHPWRLSNKDQNMLGNVTDGNLIKVVYFYGILYWHVSRSHTYNGLMFHT